jgi:hypothetical protein
MAQSEYEQTSLFKLTRVALNSCWGEKWCLDVSKFLDLSHYITNEVSFAVGVSHTKNVLFLGSHQVFYQYGAGATIYYQDNKERFFFSKVGLGIHKYVRTGRSFYLLHLAL